ncbi:hypothetical protein ACB092_01G102300 [Castanea dentata]
MTREGKSKGRIITPKATQEITILFYQKLNGVGRLLKYTEKEDHYKNGPSFIPTLIWKKVVDKWMDGD